ncbi:hypothetical protein [Accumulibacter sp.]|uniref:hypothetical protein n=1 Tax=Accumulibacter sp. TaxID=2053492 RepID=UPI0025DA6315|nr:hypothetical protein [Accumulibacter sp.]MCM8596671.1 hypothetical protein [Accumulibacter sp.]MCM8627661.1 hypothetical protein [Accumulibacter sp.]MDS4050819.1 hypothetical protein [Accumulibacter sp.]
MKAAQEKRSSGENPTDAQDDGQMSAATKAAEPPQARALATRLQAMIGRESVSSFARRCGLAESVLRTYLRDGRMPPLDKARDMAAAAGVSLDWLASGLGPRLAAEGLAAYDVAQSAAAGRDAPEALALQAAITEAFNCLGRDAAPEDLAREAVDLYARHGKGTAR